LQVQAAEDEVESDVESVAPGFLEGGNRTGRIRGRILALAHREATLGIGGVDGPENSVCLLIGRVARECRLSIRNRFEGIVLSGVEPGELGTEFGRPRVEGDRSLVGLDRLLDAPDTLEVPGEQELIAGVVALGGRLGRRRRAHGSDCRQERRQDH
jgi:hypothetical protein